jgi:hypothetical protein
VVGLHQIDVPVSLRKIHTNRDCVEAGSHKLGDAFDGYRAAIDDIPKANVVGME